MQLPRTFVLCSLLWALPAVAQEPPAAPPDPAALLKSFDAYQEQVHDRTVLMQLTLNDDGNGFGRTYKFRLENAGQDYKVTVLQPGNFRNSVFLVRDLTRTYVTQPLIHSVRRYAARPFSPLYGSAFTFMDFVVTELSPMFEASYGPAEEGKLQLITKTKPGSISPYGKIEYDLDDTTHWVDAVRFYDREGTLIRSEARSDPRCDQGICIPGVRRMTDHRSQVTSELRVLEVKFNSGLSPAVFAPNSLKRYL